ncbi:MAG: hypothetical protein ACRDTA_29465, partial [Pseudonocardiaceae bacterium]
EPPGSGGPPTVTDLSAGQWKWMWRVVAAAVVVLWLAGSLLVVFGPPWTSGSLGRPPAPAPPPIGDSRTADPCALRNVTSVQRFGSATAVGDFGYPQPCTIEAAQPSCSLRRTPGGSPGEQA